MLCARASRTSVTLAVPTLTAFFAASRLTSAVSTALLVALTRSEAACRLTQAARARPLASRFASYLSYLDLGRAVPRAIVAKHSYLR